MGHGFALAQAHHGRLTVACMKWPVGSHRVRNTSEPASLFWHITAHLDALNRMPMLPGVEQLRLDGPGGKGQACVVRKVQSTCKAGT